ncbi:hypothetical protein SDC9_88132 [bioreactor metagenome]|uniref:Uncharacterized protein n=1 Tax=bioreactor metagenome TaxID=1076179 RepID=A0A644ZL83_9ZZZZ
MVIDIAPQLLRADQIILPDGSAACLNDYLHGFRQLHLQELRKIIGGGAVIALQVTSAEIPIDRPLGVARYALCLRRGASFRAACRQRRQQHQRQQGA